MAITRAVLIKRLNQRARVPQYATLGSSGFDIRALGSYTLTPFEVAIVHTGLAFELPPGYEIQIRARGGIALNKRLVIINQPGTLDADFRGELVVLLQNVHGVYGSTVLIEDGERIAQGVLAPVVRADFQEVTGELTETSRGEGKLGSTGTY